MAKSTIGLPPGWTWSKGVDTFHVSKQLDNYVYADIRFNPDTGRYDLSKLFVDGPSVSRPVCSFLTIEQAIEIGEQL